MTPFMALQTAVFAYLMMETATAHQLTTKELFNIKTLDVKYVRRGNRGCGNDLKPGPPPTLQTLPEDKARSFELENPLRKDSDFVFLKFNNANSSQIFLRTSKSVSDVAEPYSFFFYSQLVFSFVNGSQDLELEYIGREDYSFFYELGNKTFDPQNFPFSDRTRFNVLTDGRNWTYIYMTYGEAINNPPDLNWERLDGWPLDGTGNYLVSFRRGNTTTVIFKAFYCVFTIAPRGGQSYQLNGQKLEAWQPDPGPPSPPRPRHR